MQNVRVLGPRMTQAGFAGTPTENAGDHHWLRRAACAGQSDLFDEATDPSEVRAVCAGCPVLVECRGWALRNAVDGVAGGMTATIRRRLRAAIGAPEPSISVEDFLPIDVTRSDLAYRRSGADAVLAAVARLTGEGLSAEAIAHRLGCSRRQVHRLRVRARPLAG